jgi:predicted DNA repair protein MutK
MIGGAYLSFEATEKIWQALTHTTHAEEVLDIVDPHELEARQVGGAVRTDFILSAEIMAIALSQLPELSLAMRAGALAIVAVAVTLGVYGTVALIVKMDDVGLHLSERRSAIARAVGRSLVRSMPVLLQALSLIGTAAMLWVGGGIFSHGLEEFGLGVVPHTVHDVAVAAGDAVPAAAAAVERVVEALGSAVVGLVVGGAIVAVHHFVPKKEQPA